MPGQNDSAETLVAAGGRVLFAEVGSTAPEDATTPMPVEWKELGYISDAGVKVKPEISVKDIGAWQTANPIRRLVESRDLPIGFKLLQVNADTVAFALGATVETIAGETVITPPSPEAVNEWALCVEALDEDRAFRIYCPKGMVTDVGDFELMRTDVAGFDLTYKPTPEPDEDMWQMFASDPDAFPEGS